MSDTETDIVYPAQAVSPELERKRASIAKARAARLAKPRTAKVRTADDVRDAPEPMAAARAEQTRESSIPEVVTRRRRDERQVGGLDLPKQYKKPGWDYEYKTIRVLNQPVDQSDIQDHREAGWRAEKAANWPTLCEPGTPPDAPIERMGQRLYGRPMSLTMEARQEDHEAAIRNQRDRMNAAASGKSAVRGEEGMPSGRGVRIVQGGVEIEGVAG